MSVSTASTRICSSEITRGGDLGQVLAGINAAHEHGISIKINMVALKDQNQSDLMPMAEYCASNGFDLAIIETMPLGESVSGRQDRFIAIDDFIAPLRAKFELAPLASPQRRSGALLAGCGSSDCVLA